jgi:hypothetical protein
MMKGLRQSIGFLVMILALVSLLWGSRLPQLVSSQVDLSDALYAAAQVGAPGSQLPASMIISWPGRLPVGKEGFIWARLEVKNTSNDKADSIANEYLVKPLLEARLELPGARFEPVGAVKMGYLAGSPPRFSWQVRVNETGVLKGTIWIHLIDPPDETGHSGERRLLLAQPIEIRTVTLLGIDAYLAQVLGAMGIVIGAALSADLLILFFKKIYK